MHNFENIFPKAQLSYLTYNAGWRGAFGNLNTPPYCTVALDYAPVATKQPELPENAVRISPNPASDKFVVNYSFKEATTGEMIFTNNEGKVISRRSITNAQEGTQIYHVSDLPSGQYILNVSTKLGFRATPVSIQK